MSLLSDPRGDDDGFNPLDLDIDVLTRTLTAKSNNHPEEDKGIKCCCEQDGCSAFLQSRMALLELEKDVQTAASLGKALLKRHELSLQDAAVEKKRLTGVVMVLEEKARNLEAENSDLQEENAKTIEDNRRLLLELEELNSGMNESELRAKELQEDLDAVHAELSRVSAAAAKTEILEAQLYALENEQTELKRVLNTTKEGEKAAVARWKKAERSLSEMSEQLERMEREHRIEKARAQNLLDRLEKRQLADRKSGFPSALMERTAMSQFMKEVLAENNHLQSGIAELRDMLIVSQEEVTALREQLLMSTGKIEGDEGQPLSRELLAERLVELGLPAVAPELHFHQHYHKERSGIRRTKKRRGIALPEHLRNPSKASMDNVQAPANPLNGGPSSTQSQRWSQISGHRRSSYGRVSSYSSSPGSTFTWRDSLMFDRNAGADSTRPTTPDSEYEVPPISSTNKRYSRHRQQSSINPPFSILCTVEIPEENVDEDGNMATDDAGNQISLDSPSSSVPGSILRRSASHESLLSPASALAQNPAFTVSSAMASFAPVSPLGLASTSPNSIIASHKPATEIGAAYNHLLLAGGAIRGKSKSPTATTAGSMSGRAGWLWSWGASMVRGESSTSSTSTNPIKSGGHTPTATGTNDCSIPVASSTGGTFQKKKVGTFPIGIGIGFGGSSATASTVTSMASASANASANANANAGGSIRSAAGGLGSASGSITGESTPAGTMSRHSTVPVIPIPFRTYVDHDLLRDSLMEGFQS